MKRILSISLAFIYLALACGITLKLHYCGGTIASVKLALLADGHGCECGDEAMESGCCKNEEHSFQLKSDQKHSEQPGIGYFKILKDSGPVAFLPLVKLSVPGKEYFTCYHGPPLIRNTPLYISNCVYRI